MAVSYHYWEWLNDDGSWVSYTKDDSVMLETLKRAGVTSAKTTNLTFNAGYDTVYEFNFVAMEQHNLSSKRVRKLRRVAASTVGDDEGFTRALSHMVTTTPKAAPTTDDAPTDDDGTGDVASAPPPAKHHKAETVATPAGPPGVAVVLTPAPTASAMASMWASSAAATTAPSAVSVAAAPAAVASPATVMPLPPSVAVPAPPSSAELISSTIASAIAVAPEVITAQVALGAQSLRKQEYNLGPAGKDPHGKACFEKAIAREKQLVGEFGVFYHSYSFAALLYEVQAAVAAVLFRFKSEYATLPRLLKAPFNDIPDAPSLESEFPKMGSGRDHNPRFRAVGISVSSSLLGKDPEATPSFVFLSGYSCADVSFLGVLENLLVSCGVPVASKSVLAKEIIALSAEHGLDVSQFGGPPCKSGRAGHLLQIFIKRTIVNKYAYAALPYGVPDKKRTNLAAALEKDGPICGQARIVPNPSVFMRGNAVRMYVYSADPTFHAKRAAFQAEMTKKLQPIIGGPDVRVKAAQGIYAGVLPSWFVADDHEQQEAKKKVLPAVAAVAAP